jgi:hypothetical protein
LRHSKTIRDPHPTLSETQWQRISIQILLFLKHNGKESRCKSYSFWNTVAKNANPNPTLSESQWQRIMIGILLWLRYSKLESPCDQRRIGVANGSNSATMYSWSILHLSLKTKDIHWDVKNMKFFLLSCMQNPHKNESLKVEPLKHYSKLLKAKNCTANSAEVNWLYFTSNHQSCERMNWTSSLHFAIPFS